MSESMFKSLPQKVITFNVLQYLDYDYQQNLQESKNKNVKFKEIYGHILHTRIPIYFEKPKRYILPTSKFQPAQGVDKQNLTRV